MRAKNDKRHSKIGFEKKKTYYKNAKKTVTVKNSEGKMPNSTGGKRRHTCAADERRLVVDC